MQLTCSTCGQPLGVLRVPMRAEEFVHWLHVTAHEHFVATGHEATLGDQKPADESPESPLPGQPASLWQGHEYIQRAFEHTPASVHERVDQAIRDYRDRQKD